MKIFIELNIKYIHKKLYKNIWKFKENSKKSFFLYSCIGCACRFLYGPETKDDNKAQIEKSLDGKIELKLEVIFYKKNGMLI